jgi:hypothetical protein
VVVTSVDKKRDPKPLWIEPAILTTYCHYDYIASWQKLRMTR